MRHQHADRFTTAIVDFCRFLRANGFTDGCILICINAVAVMSWQRPRTLKSNGE